MKPSELIIKINGDGLTWSQKVLYYDSLAIVLDQMAEDIYYIKQNALFTSEAALNNRPKKREWEAE